MQKSCQSYPSPRVTIFSFRRTGRDTRQKSFPPTPARATLTGLRAFRLMAKWGSFFFFTRNGLYYNSPGQRPGENALVVEMAQSLGVEMCIGFMRHNGKRQIGADYKFHGGKMLIANPLSMGNGITNPVLNGQDCKS